MSDEEEYHVEDGVKYLCHRDDHYCPSSERERADAYARAISAPPSIEVMEHIRQMIEDGTAPRRRVRRRKDQ